MKSLAKALALWLALSGSGFGAEGDILSVTITDATTAGLHNDGYYADIVIEGFTTGATWDMGSGSGADLADADWNTTDANIVFTVVSEGYVGTSLSTRTRTIYGTKVMRVKGTTNEDQAVVDTTNLRIRVALSEPIFVDDEAGVGKSGTDPIVTIKAGTFIDAGDASASSNLASGITVTNDSTLDYRDPICQWAAAGAQHKERVKADFDLACYAHGLYGISCVEFDVTDGTNTDNGNVVSAAEAFQFSATGNSVNVWKTTIPIATFDQASTLTCDFTVYPVIGDADNVVTTSGSTTESNECFKRNELSLICDKSDALDVVKYVNTGGSDSNSGDSAGTGNAYATIGKAISVGANVIYLEAGTHNLGTTYSYASSTSEWARILPAPGESSSTVTCRLNSTTRAFRTDRYSVEGVTVDMSGATAYLDGGSNAYFIRWINCDFASGGTKLTTAPICYRCNAFYFVNCTGDLGQNWEIGTQSTSRVAFTIEGCELSGTNVSSQAIDAFFLIAGCDATGPLRFTQQASANSAPDDTYVTFAWNEIHDNSGDSSNLIGYGGGFEGLAFVGNVIEKTAGTSPALQIGADGVTTDCDNILILYNTITGERCNLAYNDSGTVGSHRRWWRIEGNTFRDFNIKSDLFGTVNANRTGNWPIGYGVLVRHNTYEIANFPAESTAAQMMRGHIGLDTEHGTTGTPLDPGYVDDASFTGTGLGNGDYTPDSGSRLLNRFPGETPLMAYDLTGFAVYSDVGSLQVSTSAVAGDVTNAQVLPNGTQLQVTLVGMDHAGITRMELGRILTVHSTDTGYSGNVLGTRNRSFAVADSASPGEWAISSVADDGADVTVVLDMPQTIFSSRSVTVDTEAGAFTDGTVTSNAHTGLAVTNNSTRAYTSPTARIAGCTESQTSCKIEFDEITGTFYVEVAAASTLGVDSVTVDVDLGMANATDTATAMSRSIYQDTLRAEDGTIVKPNGLIDSTQWGANGNGGIGLWVCGPFDASTFGDGIATITAEVFPKIGDQTRTLSWDVLLNNGGTWSESVVYVDTHGTCSLSTGLSAAIEANTLMVGETSGANAIVNVVASLGATSLELCWVSDAAGFSSDEAVKFYKNVNGQRGPPHNVATATLSGTPTWTASDPGTGTIGDPYRDLGDACASFNGATNTIPVVKIKKSGTGPARATMQGQNLVNDPDTWVTLKPNDGVSRADCIVFSAGGSSRVEKIKLQDVTLNCASDFGTGYDSDPFTQGDVTYRLNFAAVDSHLTHQAGRSGQLRGTSDWINSQFTDSIYFLGCEISDVHMPACKLLDSWHRNFLVHNCAGDVFNNPGMLVGGVIQNNTWRLDLMNYTQQTGAAPVTGNWVCNVVGTTITAKAEITDATYWADDGIFTISTATHDWDDYQDNIANSLFLYDGDPGTLPIDTTATTATKLGDGKTNSLHGDVFQYWTGAWASSDMNAIAYCVEAYDVDEQMLRTEAQGTGQNIALVNLLCVLSDRAVAETLVSLFGSANTTSNHYWDFVTIPNGDANVSDATTDKLYDCAILNSVFRNYSKGCVDNDIRWEGNWSTDDTPGVTQRKGDAGAGGDPGFVDGVWDVTGYEADAIDFQPAKWSRLRTRGVLQWDGTITFPYDLYGNQRDAETLTPGAIAPAGFSATNDKDSVYDTFNRADTVANAGLGTADGGYTWTMLDNASSTQIAGNEARFISGDRRFGEPALDLATGHHVASALFSSAHSTAWEFGVHVRRPTGGGVEGGYTAVCVAGSPAKLRIYERDATNDDGTFGTPVDAGNWPEIPTDGNGHLYPGAVLSLSVEDGTDNYTAELYTPGHGTVSFTWTDATHAGQKRVALHGRNVDVEYFYAADIDPTDFLVSETGGSTIVSETGTTDTFDVVLHALPTGTVVIDVTSGDTGECTVSPSSLTFTNLDWDTPQTVTVTGVDDLIGDGTQNTNITLSIDQVSTTASEYDPVPDKTLVAQTVDDESEMPVITLPNAIAEGVMKLATISRTGSSGNEVFTLSSDESRLTVPASVTITDGNTSAQFVVEGAYTAGSQGTATATVTASNASYSDGTDTISVIDGLYSDSFDRANTLETDGLGTPDLGTSYRYVNYDTHTENTPPTDVNVHVNDNEARFATGVRTQVFIAPEMTTDDHAMSIEVASGNAATYEPGVLIRADADNQTGYGAVIAGGELRLYEFDGVTAFGSTQVNSPAPSIPLNGSSLPYPGSKLSLYVSNDATGEITAVYWDSNSGSLTTDTYTDSTYATETGLGLHGRSCDIEWAGGGEQNAPSDSITISYPLNYQVLQRAGTTPGAGTYGNLTISGTYSAPSGDPAAIEWRWPESTASWSTLETGPTGGTFSGTVTLGTVGQGNLQVRFSDNVAVTDTIDVSVGDVIVVLGQSNAGPIAEVDTTPFVPDPVVEGGPASPYFARMRIRGEQWADYAEPPFSIVDEISFDPGGLDRHSVWGMFCRLYMEQHNVPVGIVTCSTGSTGLHGYDPDGVGGTDQRGNHWTEAGTPGSLGGSDEGDMYELAETSIAAASFTGARVIVFNQGERDTTCGALGNNANASPNQPDAYETALGHLYDNLVADGNSLSGVPLIMSLVPTYNQGTASDDDLASIRQSQINAWNDNANVWPGPAGHHERFIDPVNSHWGGDGAAGADAALGEDQLVRLAGMYYHAIQAAAFGGSEARGPRFSTATIDGTAITLRTTGTVARPTGDDSYDVNMFRVEDDGTPVTVSSATWVSGTQIDLLLASTPGGTVTFSYGYGNPAHDNSIAFDDQVMGASRALPMNLSGVSSVAWPMEPITDASVAPDTGNLDQPRINIRRRFSTQIVDPWRLDSFAELSGGLSATVLIGTPDDPIVVDRIDYEFVREME